MEWFEEMRELIHGFSPTLALEWDIYANGLPSEAGEFLDRCFPAKDGWGSHGIGFIPDLLREYLNKTFG